MGPEGGVSGAAWWQLALCLCLFPVCLSVSLSCLSLHLSWVSRGHVASTCWAFPWALRTSVRDEQGTRQCTFIESALDSLQPLLSLILGTCAVTPALDPRVKSFACADRH